MGMPYKLDTSKVDFKKQIEAVRKEFETKLKEKEAKFQEDVKREVSAKESIQKMLDDIKSKQKDSGIDCPTCGHGHVHKLEGTGDGVGGIVKCTGPDCNEKYVLVDPDSDYKCVNCGLPHKKPKVEELGKKAACPFCTGTRMVAYDWKAKLDSLKQKK
jgi:DNA-directed RNA polymerase subunit RPC12/RpoP